MKERERERSLFVAARSSTRPSKNVRYESRWDVGSLGRPSIRIESPLDRYHFRLVREKIVAERTV